MKEINYNTDKLIILNYPGGAGGKFISLCLSLSPQVLHQDQEMAKMKMKNLMTDEQSFRIGMSLLGDNLKQHKELGCKEFSGFNDGHTPEIQSILANELWRELTNQNDFYFFMTTHHGNLWRHYPNAKHIILKNYEWVLKSRNKIKEFKKNNILDKRKTTHFDQKSIKDSYSFKKEIENLYSFFNLKNPNWDFLEKLRIEWINNFTKGFK